MIGQNSQIPQKGRRIEIEEIRVAAVPSRRGRLKEPFLAGPISMNWLESAGCLPGKATQMAVHLAYRMGLTRSQQVKINLSRLATMGMSRSSASRALKALEEAGLVQVQRGTGRCAIVDVSRAVAR